MRKVFCIGMYKTGTTSIGQALDALGLRTFHGSSPYFDPGIDHFAWDPAKFRQHLPRTLNLVSLFDAFEDYPFMWIYREMREAFPDAAFILTERDSHAVAMSDINMRRQLGKPSLDPQAYVDRYERHNRAVKSYFASSEQLLVMRLGSGKEWQTLCDFLELPVPRGLPFPRANARTYGPLATVAHRVGRPILHNLIRPLTRNRGS